MLASSHCAQAAYASPSAATTLATRRSRRAAVPAAACRSVPAASRWGSSSLSRRLWAAPNRGAPATANAAGAAEPGGQAATADGELPLWRYLRQCGFSEAGIARMQRWVKGTRTSAEKLQRDLEPNIAALRAEGLDTASIERLFVQRHDLLATTHATFSSALAALRQLAALLPDDPRAVQAPPGATQLGVALWLYPTASAYLLRRANLGGLIEGNLRLRRQLGISEAATVVKLFEQHALLVANFERAEAMVAHLQRLQAGGALSAEQVVQLALRPGGLTLDPAEFDRRWREGGDQALQFISFNEPQGRQQAAAVTVGELLQAAAGAPGPLQQQYQQQAAALVQRSAALVRSAPASLRANWAALRRAGLTDGDIVAVVQLQPAVLTYNWEGEAKQLLAAWLQQELGLSLAQFLRQHVSYATNSVGRLAMRAAYLQQHRPAVWEGACARGTGALLSLLSDNRLFFPYADCDMAELDAFQREWLQTPAGRRFGGKARRTNRSPADLARASAAVSST